LAKDLAMAQRRLNLPTAILALLTLVAGVANAVPSETAALVDLEVDRQVDGDVFVFGADLMLGSNSRVTGDVVAVGGDVRVHEGAQVDGHVVAVFGNAAVADETVVGGRVLSLASLASLVPEPDGRPATSVSASFAIRLLTAGGWLLVTTGLAFLFSSRVRYGSWAISSLGVKVPALGLMIGLTAVASFVAALGLGPVVGVPLVAALLVVFFVAKAVGLTILGCWAGSVLLRRWVHHPLPASADVFVGVLILLAFRFLPFAGQSLWALISLTALGAAIAVFVGISPDREWLEAPQS
jgi:hypothetical protein